MLTLHHQVTPAAVRVLIRFPYRQKISGIGANARAMNARSELPHPKFNAAYILGPARGSRAPIIDLSTVFAAVTDAAYCVYASTR